MSSREIPFELSETQLGEWEENIASSRQLFEAAWGEALRAKVMGDVVLRTGDTVHFSRREREPQGTEVLVIDHDYNVPHISEKGALFEVSEAARFVIDIGTNDEMGATTVAHAIVDFSAERAVRKEKYEITDPEYVKAFVLGFMDLKLGESAHREKVFKLDERLKSLERQRDRTLPPQSHVIGESQLQISRQIKSLLEEVKEEQPRQIARLVVAREFEN